MRQALIHRARLVTRAKSSTRDGQGEYVEAGPVPGPWFRARLMERGGPAGKSRRRPDGTDARVARGYELLADTVTIAAPGVPSVPVVLTASSLVETDCAVLGSPSFELDGRPERLTNGRRLIGWRAFSVDPSDAA